ncbi:glycosyltransferase [Puniceicoccaceae bacterium K14]|nr:glycosyltransferase [Puniceicoccaceae bacterium K14]
MNWFDCTRRWPVNGTDTSRIAFFIPSMNGGGTEKVVLLLANAAAKSGYKIDLVLSQKKGPLLSKINQNVNVIDLGGWHLYSPFLGFAKYLKDNKPSVVFSALNGGNLMALIAAKVANSECRLVFSVHNHLGEKWSKHNRIQRQLVYRVIKSVLSRSSRVVAVSGKIRSHLIEEFGLTADFVLHLPNPVDVDAIEMSKIGDAPHPWLLEKQCPVIITAGRLTLQKNYGMLIRAFTQVTAEREARLIVLGEGEELKGLKALCKKLDVEDRVLFPGFVSNPLQWFFYADLFALSSQWEGSPLVLLDAMAMGMPIVATDCPSGPRELLETYPKSRLVSVNDDEEFAKGIGSLLARLKEFQRSESFLKTHDPLNIFRRYLKFANDLGGSE